MRVFEVQSGGSGRLLPNCPRVLEMVVAGLCGALHVIAHVELLHEAPAVDIQVGTNRCVVRVDRTRQARETTDASLLIECGQGLAYGEKGLPHNVFRDHQALCVAVLLKL